MKVLQNTRQKALSKQQTSEGGPAVQPNQPVPQPVPPPSQKKGFRIPIWMWLLPLLLLPLLCCCCCICYCCCCRGKSRGNAEYVAGQGPTGDRSQGTAGAANAGGNRRSGLPNFLSNVGAAGLGTLATQFLSNRFRRGNQGPAAGNDRAAYHAGHQGGDARYAPASGEEGKNLYPSIVVQDQGGGGSWK